MCILPQCTSQNFLCSRVQEEIPKELLQFPPYADTYAFSFLTRAATWTNTELYLYLLSIWCARNWGNTWAEDRKGVLDLREAQRAVELFKSIIFYFV